MRSARLLTAATATLLSVIAWSPARAQLPTLPNQLCTADGTVDVSVDHSTGVATWRVSGTGGCTDLSDPVPMCTDRYGDPCNTGPVPDFTLSGSGTSLGAGGLCGGLVAKNLKIAATLEVPFFLSGDPFNGGGEWVSYEVKQQWVNANAIFPGATPLRIADATGGKTEGRGLIVDAAVLKCPSRQGHSVAHFALLFVG